jgi:hypothetical protein
MSANPWGSDRAGSRYFGVMSHQAYSHSGAINTTSNPTGDVPNNFDPAANSTTGRFSPGYANWYTAFMINPFIKYKGLEFFGTLEFTNGGNKKGSDSSRNVDQYAADLVYRFGEGEKFYIGARYNIVSGEISTQSDKVNVDRFESSVGWFMTKNIIAKLAYTNQNYSSYSQFSGISSSKPSGTSLNDLYGGHFDGLMFEAAISF